MIRVKSENIIYTSKFEQNGMESSETNSHPSKCVIQK